MENFLGITLTRKNLGIVLALSSTIYIATADLFIKIFDQEYSIFQLVLFSELFSLFVFIVCFYPACVQKQWMEKSSFNK